MMIRAREDDAAKKSRDTVKELEAYCAPQSLHSLIFENNELISDEYPDSDSCARVQANARTGRCSALV
jgi:hypothetical protein